MTEDEDTDYEREYGKGEAVIDFGNGITQAGNSSDGYSLDGTIITLGEGEVRVQLSADITTICDFWEITIWDEWPEEYGDDVMENMACNGSMYFGGIYDPTHTCIEYSSSIWCYNGDRCPNLDIELSGNYLT